MNDMELVRAFAEQQSDEAFAELVRRYINLVYSVAFRLVENPADAQDVSQAVFIILARKAGGLSPNTILPGWFYETTRLAAGRHLRTQSRRHAREQEAYMQSTLNEADISQAWHQIEPHLETAMARLSQSDRTLLTLRFYENKTGLEAAEALGIGKSAAHKRTARALQKLRKFFVCRGITCSVVTISAAISANSVQAAPATLLSAVSAASAAKGTVATASLLTLVKGTLKTMAWTKAKTALAMTGILIVASGGGILAIKAINAARIAHYPNIEGTWEGVATHPQSSVSVHGVIKLKKSHGTYGGKLDGIELGIKDLSFDHVDYNYPRLRLSIPSGVFNGTVDTNKHEISGVYHEANFRIPIVFKLTDHPQTVPDLLKAREYAQTPSSSIQGLWKGLINDRIHLQVKIAAQADGTFRGELDNLDWISGQLLTVRYQAPNVELIVNSGAGMFKGQLNASNTVITGSWIENGATGPLTLERVISPYHPIPDNEPAITDWMRNFHFETLQEKECTPDFWKELQARRKTENPEFSKAIASALGNLQDLALVERTNDNGRASYLYRMEYENMNVLFRIILDNGKVAYASGEREP